MKNQHSLWISALTVVLGLPNLSAVMHPSPELITLAGKVVYVALEGGFYQVSGYRLTGKYDFARYLHQTVSVQGYPDTSMSIYMVKTLRVTHLTFIHD